MFEVVKKGGGPELDVYAVGGGRFLTWIEDENPHWEWPDLNEYEPAPVTATELMNRCYKMTYPHVLALPDDYVLPDRRAWARLPDHLVTEVPRFVVVTTAEESHLNNTVPENLLALVTGKEET